MLYVGDFDLHCVEVLLGEKALEVVEVVSVEVVDFFPEVDELEF